MTPSEQLNIPIKGKIITRKIDDLSINGVKSSIPEEQTFELLDEIMTHEGKVYLVNKWGNKEQDKILFIHKHFVKEVHRKRQP